MTHEEFFSVIRDQVHRCDTVLLRKAGEYSTDDDRLVAFRKAAHLQGKTLAQAIVGQMSKHTVSIYDMVESGHSFTAEQWNEKITDHLNYLFLLRAAVEEDLRAQEAPNT